MDNRLPAFVDNTGSLQTEYLGGSSLAAPRPRMAPMSVADLDELRRSVAGTGRKRMSHDPEQAGSWLQANMPKD